MIQKLHFYRATLNKCIVSALLYGAQTCTPTQQKKITKSSTEKNENYLFIHLPVYIQIKLLIENRLLGNLHYEISREKFEPEPGFEPRTSGFHISKFSFYINTNRFSIIQTRNIF